MRILVINPGATSTKIAVFDGDKEAAKKTIDHDAGELAGFDSVVAQKGYRLSLVEDALRELGYSPGDFDAVCSRGGLLRHIPSGTYRVTDRVIADVLDPPYGEHASNLGVLLAREIANEAGIPAFFVDPISVDEMEPTARISGFKGMERESFFHALNQKSMARQAARELGRPYEELNLVVCHLGGGVSTAAHKKGRVTDVFNVKDDGAFSADRGGALPVNAVINYCFSGRTKAEVKRTLGGSAGIYSYLGTKDFREVERRAAAGEGDFPLIYDAFVYQQAKDIGAMAAALSMEVDAIVLTGGMANSARLCESIKSYVGRITPVLVLPGEAEMRSLAEGALRVLRGEPAKEY